jgi:hypothetical protein
MSNKKWIVMFGSEGWEVLIPCDGILIRDTLNWFGGDNSKGELNQHLMLAYMRARSNGQRRPEIWSYDTEQAFSEEEMQSMWNDSPQRMADLVRSKGSLIYKEYRNKSVIK